MKHVDCWTKAQGALPHGFLSKMLDSYKPSGKQMKEFLALYCSFLASPIVWYFQRTSTRYMCKDIGTRAVSWSCVFTEKRVTYKENEQHI